MKSQTLFAHGILKNEDKSRQMALSEITLQQYIDIRYNSNIVRLFNASTGNGNLFAVLICCFVGDHLLAVILLYCPKCSVPNVNLKLCNVFRKKGGGDNELRLLRRLLHWYACHMVVQLVLLWLIFLVFLPNAL